eukprot:gene410-744_t
MGRGRGKGKGRGGGRRMFIANEDELALRDRHVAEGIKQREDRRGADDDDDEEDDEDDETKANDEAGVAFDRTPPSVAAAATTAAEELEEEPKPKGLLAGVSGVANPNAVNKALKQMKIKDMKDVDVVNPEEGLSRREREALEAERKKTDYMKRHLAGETEQAKKEMALLAIVKQRREDAKAKREAEGRKPGMSKYGLEDGEGDDDSDDDDEDSEEEEKKPTATKAIADAKRKAAAGEEPTAIAADGGPPKLKALDIKKMNPDALKDGLKARGLDIQGQKKDLLKRLLDYEAARP